MDFQKRYAKLNDKQKEAVDLINGPVMVIAGPGTGKTELLSVRVANILDKTDTLPENILCLTFTDSGAVAMRQRLIDIIGKDAYKVAIHTFHSFGSEIINQNSKYFYNNAQFKAADELSSYEIIKDILADLTHSNPLVSQMNGEYTYQKDILTTISEIKRNGLNSEEFEKILDTNDQTIEIIEPILSPVFESKISKSTISLAAAALTKIQAIKFDQPSEGIVSLGLIIADSLEIAISEAGEKNTKPITSWKNSWLEKNDKNEFQLKSKNRQKKLHALNDIYKKYLKTMQEKQLYDYDDMILQTVHKIEQNDDLRFNLQEKYQYIMVDEFQDTNLAQMRILRNLTNNPAQGDTPNILIVGDDDQAIYSFQGADVSNIIDFQDNFPKTKAITLNDNYRSSSEILDSARSIIKQGTNRLENIFKNISKQLSAQFQIENSVKIYEAENIAAERLFVAKDIRSKIDAGQLATEITVIARGHKEINELLPYLYHQGINVNYERQDNILDQEIIILIEKISKLFTYLSSNRHDEANNILPEILAHQCWGIEPIKLWQLSCNAYDQRKRWLDTMSDMPEFTNIKGWIIENANKVNELPLEQMLDIIIGKPTDDQTRLFSPIYKHFFNTKKLSDKPSEYLDYLESIRTIREKLREYRPDQTPTLQTYTNFISLNRQIGRTIETNRQSAKLDNAINVMTAHKSKGLEFDIVYIINGVDSNWGEKSRGKSRSINYPENLKLAPAGDNEDERLRLFYVSMTRAKKQLNITYSLRNNNAKETLKANFLLDEKWQVEIINTTTDIDQLTTTAELNWYQPLISPITTQMNELLKPILEKYKLSTTHLTNFIDFTKMGPEMFLLNSLLKFPSAKSASADFGSAIHFALQSAHNHLSANNKRMVIEKVIEIFQNELAKQHMSKTDFNHFNQKGIDVLNVFLSEKYDSFSTEQQTELGFSNQQSMIDDVILNGKLDLVNIDKSTKTITVTDYKTGKAPVSKSGNDEYEKIKLHKYNQQLMFYKLLVESSRDYHNFSVNKGIIQFVEPTKSGNIISTETDFSDNDLEKFEKLVKAVWKHIINLDFPDTNKYPQTLKGILAFEDDLINQLI